MPSDINGSSTAAANSAFAKFDSYVKDVRASDACHGAKISTILGSDEMKSALNEAADQISGLRETFIDALRQSAARSYTGPSLKKVAFIGVGSIVGLYVTLKLINAAINYETQRLAIKNGIIEALPKLKNTNLSTIIGANS